MCSYIYIFFFFGTEEVTILFSLFSRSKSGFRTAGRNTSGSSKNRNSSKHSNNRNVTGTDPVATTDRPETETSRTTVVERRKTPPLLLRCRHRRRQWREVIQTAFRSAICRHQSLRPLQRLPALFHHRHRTCCRPAALQLTTRP